MFKKIIKKIETKTTETNLDAANNTPSSKNDFWIKNHQRELNKRIESKKAEIFEDKAKNMISDYKEIYHEWVKNGKRLYQCSDDISLPSIKQFIALSTKYGILEIQAQELEDDKYDRILNTQANELEEGILEDKLKKMDQRIELIHKEMDKIFEDLGRNGLIKESNWEELFEKYKQDAHKLDPSDRDENYNNMLKKFCSKEIYAIKLQQTAINIGKRQKLLKETGNESHREYLNTYQNQFDTIISSTYATLTGRQLAEESSKYISPWLSDNDTVSESMSTSNETDLLASEHKSTTNKTQHSRNESLINHYTSNWETTETADISNQKE